MEMAIYRKRYNQRWILLLLAMICIMGLIPSAIIFASALTDPTIGMNGVNDSDLTVGMAGVDHSDLLLDYNPADWHLNPSEFAIALSVPIVFFLVALLFIVGMIFSPGLNIKTIIIIGVLIFIALALLAMVNFNTNSLFGG